MSLLLHITILLGVTLLLVTFTRQLGIAAVLGYLASGLILGPSGLNWFPATLLAPLLDSAAISLVFLMGLELRPQRLWAMREQIVKLGGLQILGSGLLLMAVLLWIFHLSLLSSFMVGFALALSSMLLILQLLVQSEQLNSSQGQASLAISLAQVLAALFLIALLPLFTRTATSQHGIAYFAAILTTLSGVFLFGRYLLQPFLNYLARQNSLELMAVTAVLTGLLVMLLMSALHLHPLIGALLTGMLLANTPFRHAFEAMVKPFRSLMTGMFFTGMGLSTSLVLLGQQAVWILGLLLALLIIKTGVLLALGRYFRLSLASAGLLGLGLFHSGELTFLVLYAAFKEQLLDQALMDPLSSLLVLSMLISPVFYWLARRFLQPSVAPLHSDAADETPSDLIIAGFGRFGQIIARVAQQQGLCFSVLDNNQPGAEFIDHYGGRLIAADLNNPEALQRAGIDQAKMLIIAIDDVEDCMHAVRYLRLNYPDLTLLVRARDRYHVHLLQELGVEHIWRETYLSALDMAEYMLQTSGLAPEQAQAQLQAFRQQDESLLEQQQRLNRDDHKIYETHGNAMAELEHLFAHDQLSSSSKVTKLNQALENYRSDVTRGGQN